jgi:hypothetical protein
MPDKMSASEQWAMITRLNKAKRLASILGSHSITDKPRDR